jgi:hypothetical protein
MVTQRKRTRKRQAAEWVRKRWPSGSGNGNAMTNLPSKYADIKNKSPERRMSGEVEEQNRIEDAVEEATEESAKGKG